jgi:hypothetical protein
MSFEVINFITDIFNLICQISLDLKYLFINVFLNDSLANFALALKGNSDFVSQTQQLEPNGGSDRLNESLPLIFLGGFSFDFSLTR